MSLRAPLRPASLRRALSSAAALTLCTSARATVSPRTRTAARYAAAASLACVLAAAPARAQLTDDDARPHTGPARGALVLAGGGSLGDDIIGRFVTLAGGADARIVILPAAGTDEYFPEDWPGFALFRRAGVRDIHVLHTRDRGMADSDAFAGTLRTATGVWITGGRQWRLVDSYLGTRTVAELHALLERGGVIGGTSAGASIQASYMVRGAIASNTIMMAPGYEEGFGFLRNTAIDQHLLARGRENDMLEVIDRHPHLLGIGLDEGTAIVVRGDEAEVVGRGSVAFYNARDRGTLPYYFLRAGDRFDLGTRRTTDGTPIAPASARTVDAVVAAMNRLFDAMRAQDTAAIRAMSHPELRLFVPGTHPDGTPALRVSTLQQFIEQVAASPVPLDERAVEPEVRIDGNLAIVWTYYDFFRGAEFSHCGYDAFHFARTAAGTWQIIGLAYTVRREGCRGR